MTLTPALDLTRSNQPTAPPHNLEAEQALLGALLFDNASLERITEKLLPRHFFEPFHARLFQAVSEHVRAGRLAEPIMLVERFSADEAFVELGGVRYLADLVDRSPPSVHAADYAWSIYELALRRDLIFLGGEISTAAADPENEADPFEQIEAAESKLFDIVERGGGAGDRSASEYAEAAIQTANEAFSRDGGLSGLSTGLADLDAKLGGLHKPDLIILGGRPSMGKSALAFNVAYSVARDGESVGVFSLEMDGEQVITRLAAEASRVSGDRIRRGEVKVHEFQAFHTAAREIGQLPLYIDDTGGLSIARLATRARRMKRRHGIKLLIVDYLQLVTVDDGRRSDNRVQDVTKITQALKALAKDLELPVIALSQLSREVERRDDKRPQLADLRESGSIEQDADVVMFLYREAYYLARAEPKEGTDEHRTWSSRMDEVRNLADLNIAKQRHGPIGTIKLHFNEDLTKFSNLAREWRYDAA